MDFAVGCMVELGYEVTPFARGFNEGDLVEVNVGEPNEGDCDGSSVGLVDGSSVGPAVGRRKVGCRVGFLEGLAVRTIWGQNVGRTKAGREELGKNVGTFPPIVGDREDKMKGLLDGQAVAISPLGINVGSNSGLKVGSSVGIIVGNLDGRDTGVLVGTIFIFDSRLIGDLEMVGSVDGCRVELGYDVAPFASGFRDGDFVSTKVGELNDGMKEGSSVGPLDGSSVGLTVGRCVLGKCVGWGVLALLVFGEGIFAVSEVGNKFEVGDFDGSKEG